MKYEFKSANGQVCCSGDTFAHLCSACKKQASAVPPPPDLTASIRRHRATTHLTTAQRRERARQIVADQPRPMANGERP